MKKIVLCLILVLALSIFSGCGEPGDSTDTTNHTNTPIQNGNRFYIPINVYGSPSDRQNTANILQILSDFERKNPNRRIPCGGWSIEKRQAAYGVSSIIYGLWVDTEPISPPPKTPPTE